MNKKKKNSSYSLHTSMTCSVSSHTTFRSRNFFFFFSRNRSAESLYGWKDREVFGQRVTEFLIAEEFHSPHKKIMERLASGQSWSGQFPFKKRSGEILMAVVTKSPLYEDGELAGFITVSSDAEIFNSINPQHPRPYPNRGKMRGLNLKKIQWQPHRPQIAQVPNISSSVTNLVRMYTLVLFFISLFWC